MATLTTIKKQFAQLGIRTDSWQKPTIKRAHEDIDRQLDDLIEDLAERGTGPS